MTDPQGQGSRTNKDRFTHLADLELIANALDDAQMFDLMFYGAFAERTMTVMKREGKDTEGFDRMQDSVKDALEKVRSLIESAGHRGFPSAARYTAPTAEALGALLEFCSDLAVLKDADLNEDSRNRTPKSS